VSRSFTPIPYRFAGSGIAGNCAMCPQFGEECLEILLFIIDVDEPALRPRSRGKNEVRMRAPG